MFFHLSIYTVRYDVPCTNLAVVVKRKKERNIYGCWFLPHESAPSIYLVASDSQSYLVNRHLFRLLSDSSAYKLFLFLCGANLSLTDSIATCTLQHECITLRLATPQMHLQKLTHHCCSFTLKRRKISLWYKGQLKKASMMHGKDKHNPNFIF